jgi:hypothetical protein
MAPLWLRVALFLVVLACAVGALVVADLGDERASTTTTLRFAH